MGEIGHNGGPSMEGGVSWRKHCWSSARERLLPVLPVEVVRLRVKRARALGLDYRTYAGVRAALGKLPSDQVILVGDLGLERDWCAAGRLAGYLPAERYFAAGA